MAPARVAPAAKMPARCTSGSRLWLRAFLKSAYLAEIPTSVAVKAAGSFDDIHLNPVGKRLGADKDK